MGNPFRRDNRRDSYDEARDLAKANLDSTGRIRAASGRAEDASEDDAKANEARKQQRLNQQIRERRPDETDEQHEKRLRELDFKEMTKNMTQAEIDEYKLARHNAKNAKRLESEPEPRGTIAEVVRNDDGGIIAIVVKFDTTHPIAPNRDGSIEIRVYAPKSKLDVGDTGVLLRNLAGPAWTWTFRPDAA